MNDPIWTTPQLPHTGPMHWLDQVALAPDGTHTLARTTIPANHPFARDGILQRSALIELLAQAAAASSALKAAGAGKRIKQGFLAAIREITFHGDLPIATLVEIVVHQEHSFGPLTQVRLEAHTTAGPLSTARMTFHLTFD